MYQLINTVWERHDDVSVCGEVYQLINTVWERHDDVSVCGEVYNIQVYVSFTTRGETMQRKKTVTILMYSIGLQRDVNPSALLCLHCETVVSFPSRKHSKQAHLGLIPRSSRDRTYRPVIQRFYFNISFARYFKSPQ